MVSWGTEEILQGLYRVLYHETFAVALRPFVVTAAVKVIWTVYILSTSLRISVVVDE